MLRNKNAVANVAVRDLGVARVIQFAPVGDHTLVIGQVRDGAIQSERTPLTSGYTGWTYSG